MAAGVSGSGKGGDDGHVAAPAGVGAGVGGRQRNRTRPPAVVNKRRGAQKMGFIGQVRPSNSHIRIKDAFNL